MLKKIMLLQSAEKSECVKNSFDLDYAEMLLIGMCKFYLFILILNAQKLFWFGMHQKVWFVTCRELIGICWNAKKNWFGKWQQCFGLCSNIYCWCWIATELDFEFSKIGSDLDHANDDAQRRCVPQSWRHGVLVHRAGSFISQQGRADGSEAMRRLLYNNKEGLTLIVCSAWMNRILERIQTRTHSAVGNF